MKRRTLLRNNHDNIRIHSDNSEQSPLTFDEAISRLLSENKVKGLSPETNQFYIDQLTIYRKFHLAVYNSIPPLSVNKRHISDFIDFRINTIGVSLNGVITSLRALKRYCTFIYSKGWTKDNPFHDFVMPKKKDVHIETFTVEQINKILSVCNTDTFVGYRDYVVILLLLDTGVRLRELTDIKVDDVNLSDKYVRVFGKSQKYRNMPLSDTMCSALRRYLNVRGSSPSDKLFISQNDTDMSGKTLQDRLSHYGRKAGITDVRVSPHTFRHTFAKMYVQSGGSIFILQDLLGHSTLEMVRTYVKLFSPDLAKDHRKHSPLNRI